MQKVVLFIDSLGSGGAQRQLVLLARLLNEAEYYEPIVVCYHQADHLKFMLDDVGISYHLIKKNHIVDLMFLVKFVLFLRRVKPDVLVSYLNTPNMWARLAGLFVNINCIITSERNIDLYKSKLRVCIERLLFPLSDKVVVNAYSIKEMLTASLGFDVNKIKVIYNAVDTNVFYPLSNETVDIYRHELGLSTADYVIALPGRLQGQKNHMCLINALLDLDSKTLSKIKVLFVGYETDLSLKEKLIEIISKNNLQSVIRFCGVKSDMTTIYNLSDIIILPSLWEGLPNVVIEAMACERLVVVSNIADNSKIIEHGKNGFIFKSNDSHQLSKLIEECIALNAKALNEIRKSAKQWVIQNCSPERFIADYSEIMKSTYKSNNT